MAQRSYSEDPPRPRRRGIDRAMPALGIPELRKWRRCKKCGLCRYRHTVVIGEGDVPADVMMIGEGPGKAENLLGRPFVGGSGRLLRNAFKEVKELQDRGTPRIFLTNVVACRPCDGVREPNRPPSDEEAWACMPRLIELVEHVSPRTVVFLGNVAERFLHHLFPAGHKLVHPAAVLRSGGKDSPSYLSFLRDMAAAFDQSQGEA